MDNVDMASARTIVDKVEGQVIKDTTKEYMAKTKKSKEDQVQDGSKSTLTAPS